MQDNLETGYISKLAKSMKKKRNKLILLGVTIHALLSPSCVYQKIYNTDGKLLATNIGPYGANQSVTKNGQDIKITNDANQYSAGIVPGCSTYYIPRLPRFNNLLPNVFYSNWQLPYYNHSDWGSINGPVFRSRSR